MGERLERAKTSVMTIFAKSEKKIQEVGEKVDKEIEKKDWKKKISGFFEEKFKRKGSKAEKTESTDSNAEHLNNVDKKEDE